MILSAGEASIALRTANDELARRVQVQVSVLAVPRQIWGSVLHLHGGEGGTNDVLLQCLVLGATLPHQ